MMKSNLDLQGTYWLDKSSGVYVYKDVKGRIVALEQFSIHKDKMQRTTDPSIIARYTMYLKARNVVGVKCDE